MSEHGYRTIDLTPWCTGRATQLPGAAAPTGRQLFHGVPFQVGGVHEQDPAFVLLRDGEAPRVVPLNGKAHHVLVAHRLIEAESDLAVGAGSVCGSYVFQFADGVVEEQPIRRRLHVDVAPSEGWDMDLPFDAVLSSTPHVPDRWAGEWELLGDRRSEGCLPLPPAYFLWTWTNPRPEVPLEALELRPGRECLVVAAVTLGTLPEHPFVRTAPVPVKVLVRGEPVPDPLKVQLSVDRGVASYTYPVTAGSAADFVAGRLSGWGREPNPTEGGYAHLAGTPSATIQVAVGGEPVGSAPWATLREEGRVSAGPAELQLLDHGRNWVHVTVVDDDTGRPVPCRVHFRSPDGVSYPPHGHHEYVSSGLGSGGDVRLGGITYAYIDGTCQGWLPRGEVLAEIVRGFEYEVLQQVVTVEPATRELTFRIRRWVSMNERGWYSGDSHAHFLTAQGAAFEQRAEDLNVVNLLATQWGSLFTSTEEFTGREHRPDDDPFVTYVSQENRQHILGHLVLWGLSQPVMPWCTDGLPEASIGAPLEVTLSDWADRCHAQGGTVVVPHIPRPNGELAALVATGRADALEMIVQHRDAHEEYYRYLNCGYRLPLVGGTDKMSAEVAIGQYRTYAHLGDEEFSYQAWCRAVRAGRTFLSGGPLLDLQVDGHAVGDTVSVMGGGTVEVSVSVESALPIHSLELVHDGRVIATAEDAAGERRLCLRTAVKVDSDGWLAARVGGPGYFGGPGHHDVWQRAVFAHTSPVYLSCGRRWDRYDEGVAGYMDTLLRGALGYVRATAAHHDLTRTTHHHGEADHLVYLERPFKEALEALAERRRSR